MTEDLDVFVDPSPANARRLHAALSDFGFGAVLPPADAFAEPGQVFMLGRKPNRIDILTSIDGVGFAEAWAGKAPVDFDGGPLFVIGRDALLANKRAARRKKDLADVEALETLAKKPAKRRPSTRRRR
ncbi:MAG: hypothetical protein NVS3B10_16050 [Polyangiales bacterium]